ncbi:MAG: hypothetical protein H0T62_07830 [Parachlamydiaceae bacterium]|nr:hypothetical protein [Parachlamydiaceae bacterium]
MPHLIHIGNSLGVRIPKALITQVGFNENIDLVFKVTDEGLLISVSGDIRQGWTEAFEAADNEYLFMGRCSHQSI